jgi:hypothetical protein
MVSHKYVSHWLLNLSGFDMKDLERAVWQEFFWLEVGNAPPHTHTQNGILYMFLPLHSTKLTRVTYRVQVQHNQQTLAVQAYTIVVKLSPLPSFCGNCCMRSPVTLPH